MSIFKPQKEIAMAGTDGPNVQTVQIIGIGLAGSNLMLAVAAFAMKLTGIIPPEGFIEGVRVGFLGPVLTVCALVLVALSFALKRVLMERADDLRGRATANIMALALCDAAGVFGFVLAFLTGNVNWGVALMAAGFAGCIFHVPTRRSLGQ